MVPCLSVLIGKWNELDYMVTRVAVVSFEFFHKHTELAITAILASQTLRRQKMEQQNVTSVSIESGTSAIQV